MPMAIEDKKGANTDAHPVPQTKVLIGWWAVGKARPNPTIAAASTRQAAKPTTARTAHRPWMSRTRAAGSQMYRDGGPGCVTSRAANPSGRRP